MPGHKRNLFFNIPSAEIDITEIDGFDNLHNPKEVISELEKELTAVYGSKKSIISVNGSTCCILAAISAVCHSGDKIIIARNCHKSVYNACLINRLHIIYIEPEFDERFGIYTTVTQESVDNAIRENPDAKAIVITSPTYEGIVTGITAAIPVIADSAHGSHFGFADYLPDRVCGDIVVNSLHKTLPCLTQCAAVHIHNDSYINSVKKYMDIFETSSPSYVLLSAIDRCVDFLTDCDKAFKHYKILLDRFYDSISELTNIFILKNDDITRIVLGAHGYSGAELADVLRKNNIEPEAIGMNYVILISTVCDTEKGFNMLINVLKTIEIRSEETYIYQKPIIPKKIFEQFEIKDTEITSFENSAGRICGEAVFAYPPDIPLITAGERIDNETLEYITNLINSGVNILSDSDLLPDSILTKKD